MLFLLTVGPVCLFTGLFAFYRKNITVLVPPTIQAFLLAIDIRGLPAELTVLVPLLIQTFFLPVSGQSNAKESVAQLRYLKVFSGHISF